MADLPTKAQWDDENYEWPVVPVPDAAIVERLGKQVIATGGRAVKEAHADRGVTMDFPNPAFPDTRLRKQIPRAECRRRAQVVMPLAPDDHPAAGTPPRQNADPLKVCVACDAVHLWPSMAA